MEDILYEFDSVTDRRGVCKLRLSKIYNNPVKIDVLVIGKSAILSYVHRKDMGITTSRVESIAVIGNMIKVITANTEYWLKPYAIRREKN